MKIEMKKALLLFVGVLLIFGANCQINKYGYPFYRYFSMDEYGGTEQNWAVVKDSRGIMYIGNNDAGVLEYDGTNWRQIAVPSIVRSLAVSSKGVVYVGAVGDFGVLLPDHSGTLEYVSLLSKLDSTKRGFTNVYKTYANDSCVYFCATNYLFKYTFDTISAIKLPKFSFYTFIDDSTMYVGNYKDALLKYDSGCFCEKIGFEQLSHKNISYFHNCKDSISLIGTYSNGLYYLNNNTKIVKPSGEGDLNVFLKGNTLYNAIDKNGVFAFSTLSGGIVHSKELGFTELYDKNMGLPDDQTSICVYSQLGINSPLWSGLNNGIIRISWDWPFRVLDERNGLVGAVSDIIRFNNKLYVTTSSGLYEMSYGKYYPVFENVLKQQIWKLFPYKYSNAKDSVLLIGTIDGLYELNKKGKISSFESRIKNQNIEGQKYYVFEICTPSDDKSELFLGTSMGVVVLRNHNRIWVEEFNLEKKIKKEVRSIVYEKDNKYLFSTSFDGILEWKYGTDNFKNVTKNIGVKDLKSNKFYSFNGSVYNVCQRGIYKYNSDSNKFFVDTVIGQLPYKTKSAVLRLSSDSSNVYMAMNKGDKYFISRIDFNGNYSSIDTSLFNVLPNVQTDKIFCENNIVYFGSSKGIVTFNKKQHVSSLKDFSVLLRKVTIVKHGKDSIVFGGVYYKHDSIQTRQCDDEKISLPFNVKEVRFEFSAPFFDREDLTQYSYKLEGYDNEWSKWDNKTQKEYTNLSEGEYIFKVRAKNAYGMISDESSVNFHSEYFFKITPPWYRTIVAYIVYLLLLIFVVRLIVRWRTKKLEEEKQQLEIIVKERTAEIVEKKEELERQRDEIAEKNQSITDSILYASRIQRALLPSTEMIADALPEHFILFKPRDIVSGDYYWMTRIEDYAVIVAADCTGHGVPGAFMSMLGMSFLNEIVGKNMVLRADEILNQLRAHVIDALKQKGEGSTSKDGMDLALYIINLKTNELEFAGANNPLYVIRPQTDEERSFIANQEFDKLPKRVVYDDNFILEELKADKMPIGIYIKNKPFSSKKITLTPNSHLYTFSDGFVDQFGGSKKRKFMTKAFKQLLMKIYDKPMAEQRDILDDTIVKWIEDGDEVQVDDILVFGVRIV